MGLGVGSYFKVVSMLYLKLQLLHAFSFHFEVAVLSRSPFVVELEDPIKIVYAQPCEVHAFSFRFAEG